MKVFISHQQADTATATRVAQRLKTHGIESYLDVIDPALLQRGEDLAEHLKTQLGRCTQLIAVISPATKESSWVPWEIGVASEKDFPLATFSDGTKPPEFLVKWPYMRTLAEVDLYAQASLTARRAIMESFGTATAARKSPTREFYRELRSKLGQ